MIPPTPEGKVVCPHCGVTFRSEWTDFHVATDADGQWRVRFTTCAECERLIAFLQHYTIPPLTALTGGAVPLSNELMSERMIRPRTANRGPIPTNVPKAIADDYTEAANVLGDSAKASAALSRRCLQNLLVEKAAGQEEGAFRPDPGGA